MIKLSEMEKHWIALDGWKVDGSIWLVTQLMFHVSLIIDVNAYSYEQRFCFKDLALAQKAVEEYISTGKLRYWHKDHTKNISVKNGYLFPPGADQDEIDQAIGIVDWA